MTTMRSLFLSAALLGATTAPAAANPLDAHWLKANAQANVSEIQTARWILGQTGDASVTTLARRLIRDHTKALHADQSLARSLGLKLKLAPTPDALWALRELRQEVARGDVDKAYAMLEVADHRVNIQATQEEVGDGSAPPVVGLARATLPVLEAHLEMARQTLAHVS